MKMKKTLCLLLVMIMMLCSVFSVATSAADFENPIEDTSVMDDLNAMKFVVSNFPKDTSADFISVIDFTEYGYSAKGNTSYYGLYVYVYNPSGKAIASYSNYLQLSYVTKSGSQTTYAKYRLELLSVSEDTGYENLFYKFRIEYPSGILSNIAPGQRCYSLSGIELNYTEYGVTDFPVEQTWKYSGYQANFGKTAGSASTLQYSKDVFEVAEIEMHPASWMSDTADLGVHYRYEILSVYFNIPDYFVNTYGDPLEKGSDTSSLYAVRGEYTKLLTNGLVVSNENVYGDMQFQENYDLNNISSYMNGCYGNGFGFIPVCTCNIEDYLFSYNMECGIYPDKSGSFSSNFQLSTLHNLLYSEDCTLSMNEFYEEWIANGKPGNIHSAWLYNNGSEIFKNLGKQSYDISVDDPLLNDSIKSWASANGKGWLHRLFNSELYIDEDGYLDIKPIVEFTPTDFTGWSDASVSENLFVTEADAGNMRTFAQEFDLGNHTYLMRLDVNPYYTSTVTVTDDNTLLDRIDNISPTTCNAMYFEKAVLRDIDIFEFEFRSQKHGPKIVPVSCEPIDNVGTIVPGPSSGVNPNNPDDEPADGILDMLRKIFSLILVLAVVFLAIFAFTKIAGGVGVVVRSIAPIVDLVDRSSERRRRKNEERRKDAEERRKDADERRRDREESRKDDENRRKEEDHTMKKFNFAYDADRKMRHRAKEIEKNRSIEERNKKQ